MSFSRDPKKAATFSLRIEGMACYVMCGAGREGDPRHAGRRFRRGQSRNEARRSDLFGCPDIEAVVAVISNAGYEPVIENGAI